MYNIDNGVSAFGRVEIILIQPEINKSASSVSFLMNCMQAWPDHDQGLVFLDNTSNHICIPASELASFYTLNLYDYMNMKCVVLKYQPLDMVGYEA